MPAFWVIEDDPAVKVALRRPSLGVLMNSREVFDAMCAFFAGLPGDGPWTDALPPDFPTPLLLLPGDPAQRPDYFVWGCDRFVSDTLRRTLDLPETAASWVACEVVADPRERLRYWMFHPRALQPVVDLQRSRLHLTPHHSARTGNTIRLVSALQALRFVEGITPAAPVLIDTVIGEHALLATDATARAVVRAGCTGIVFVHPLSIIPGAHGGVVLGRDGPERRLYDDTLERVVAVQAVDPVAAESGTS